MANFSDRDGWIWLDGEMLPWREAKTHVLTYSLHYGVGCFEGVRAYETADGPAIFRLREHTDRLLNSAKILGMPCSWSAEVLDQAQHAVIRDNALKQAYLRPMMFYGSEGMGLRAEGLKTHVMVAAWPWGNYLGESAMLKGIRVRTASFSRHHVNSAMCRAKANGQYIVASMALNEVLKDGYDEALMLDTQGFVAEGSAENIFLVKDGQLHTPDVTACLDGITRKTIIKLAEDFGLKVFERRITRDEVYVADEAFFTGTAAEVTPIREVDNRAIGNGGRGPVTERLQAAYLAAVKGQAPAYRHWLSLVR
ncbi:MAG TPA: branched-chain amino acid transaminase [Fontimonas sp.]